MRIWFYLKKLNNLMHPYHLLIQYTTYFFQDKYTLVFILIYTTQHYQKLDLSYNTFLHTMANIHSGQIGNAPAAPQLIPYDVICDLVV